MIKYRLSWGKIEPFEVLKETQKQLTYKYIDRYKNECQSTEAKKSSYVSWHESWEEARKSMLDDVREEYTACEEKLSRIFHKMRTIEEMENPESKKAAP